MNVLYAIYLIMIINYWKIVKKYIKIKLEFKHFNAFKSKITQIAIINH